MAEYNLPLTPPAAVIVTAIHEPRTLGSAS